jgi:hypothetical protein
MDELDRMYRRLVHNIRAGFPDLLAQPIEVASVYQHLIPYRLNRRELGLESADDYELTLTRLLSGARGLLEGDAEMQAALKSELDSPNPDLSVFRAFGTARVQLVPEAIHALDAQSPAPEAESPPPPRPAPSLRQSDLAARATEEVTAASAPATPRRPGPSAAPPRPAPVVSPVSPRSRHAACRYCGGELPEGREVHFCPQCGQNLSVKQCPACSAELEVEWHYCITCGREVE